MSISQKPPPIISPLPKFNYALAARAFRKEKLSLDEVAELAHYYKSEHSHATSYYISSTELSLENKKLKAEIEFLTNLINEHQIGEV